MRNRLEEIKARLNAATAGTWAYDSNRDTHDCCIYVDGAQEEPGYIRPDNGGVVGCSEWIWIKDEDGEFIAHSKGDVEWLVGEVERLRSLPPARLQDNIDLEIKIALAAAQMMDISNADKVHMLADICKARGIDPSFLPGADTRQGKGLTDVDLERGCNESTTQNPSKPADVWFPDELVK